MSTSVPRFCRTRDSKGSVHPFISGIREGEGGGDGVSSLEVEPREDFVDVSERRFSSVARMSRVGELGVEVWRDIMPMDEGARG